MHKEVYFTITFNKDITQPANWDMLLYTCLTQYRQKVWTKSLPSKTYNLEGFLIRYCSY